MGPARYAARGWRIFPCIGKAPAVPSWTSATSPGVATIRKWLTSGKNIGLPMSANGLVAVDVDTKGLDAWAKISAGHADLDQTLRARTGSGTGYHYIFRAGDNETYRGKLADGIDIKHNGYLIVPPSTHPDTGLQYEWLNDADPAPLPEWLREQLTKPERGRPSKAVIDYPTLKDIVGRLKKHPLSYEQWVQCGMAIHSATRGEGLDLWLDLTRGVSYMPGDDELAESKWGTFRPDGLIGAGTLTHILKTLEGVGGAHDFSPASILNDEGWCVLSSGIVARINAEDRSVRTFKPSAFGVLMANRSTDDEKNLGREWLKSKDRKEYRNIVFTPNANPADLNTWTPIPCVNTYDPAAGNEHVDRILEFLLESVCLGERDRWNYLLDWTAQLVQHPEIKSTVSPVIIGDQGTGKGMFTDGLLGGILGRYYVRLDKPGVITERFNVEQSRKFLTVLDEACWRGNHDINNVLKSLTGNDTMTVEEKFGGRYTIENFSRYMVTSNSVEAVKIERSNRRYIVYEMSKIHKDMCGPIWEGIRQGGACGAFYGWLLGRDVRSFRPWEFPTKLDAYGVETKVKSMGVIGEFWWELLFEEPATVWNTEYELNKHEVWNHFNRIYPRSRVSRSAFWGETMNLIPVMREKNIRVRNKKFQGWVVEATVTDCRHSFQSTNRLRTALCSPPISAYLLENNISENDF